METTVLIPENNRLAHLKAGLMLKYVESLSLDGKTREALINALCSKYAGEGNLK